MDNELNKMELPGLPPFPKSLSEAIGVSKAYRRGLHHQQHMNSREKIQGRYDSSLLEASDTDCLLKQSSAKADQHQQCTNNSYRHNSLSSTQESLSDRESINRRASAILSAQNCYHISSDNSNYLHQENDFSNNTYLNTKQISINKDVRYSAMTKLDAKLALLKREMCNLRQLDLTLLSQLWTLNESIQGFRIVLQEQEAISLPSPTHSESNSHSSETEDGSGCISPASQIPEMSLDRCSSTSHKSSSSHSGSSSVASSMNKAHDMFIPPVPSQGKSHPQLPRILQQRTRRGAPPPTPNRFKTTHSAISQAVFPISVPITTPQTHIKSLLSSSPNIKPVTNISATTTQHI